MNISDCNPKILLTSSLTTGRRFVKKQNLNGVALMNFDIFTPNVDRDLFSQGNIYRDNFYDVWENRFKPFRDRSWAKQGICKECKHFKDCLGGGMHNWKGTDGSNTLRPLTCNCITD